MITFDGLMLILCFINLSVLFYAGMFNEHPWAKRVRDICSVLGLGLLAVAVIRVITL